MRMKRNREAAATGNKLNDDEKLYSANPFPGL
jgi:hypothetical protein